MDIGILGGTFDPIHWGHLTIAEEARQRLSLNRVIFVPAGQPWLKVDRKITLALRRIEMVRLAIIGKPYFELSTIEVDRPGPSYTADTLAFLQQKLGAGIKLFFIVGQDSFNELPEWHNPGEVIMRSRLIVFTRTDSNPTDLVSLEALVPGLKQNTTFLDITPIDISSTDIRRRATRGLSLNNLVPDAVADYILQHKLYREN
ncbi:nicotinate-nucleotide adenylyltransferase [Chloroflexota bacterium]